MTLWKTRPTGGVAGVCPTGRSTSRADRRRAIGAHAMGLERGGGGGGLRLMILSPQLFLLRRAVGSVEVEGVWTRLCG